MATKKKRTTFVRVEGAKEVFTPEFIEYLEALHDRFTPRIHELRAKRAKVLDQAIKRKGMPGPLPESEINTGDWRVPAVPAELRRP